MGDFLVKLDVDCYVEWSSVVDAPVTHTMTLEELREYVRREYGERGLSGFDARMARVEMFGTSSLDGTSAESMISCNRAGDRESTITREEIIARYAPRSAEKRSTDR